MSDREIEEDEGMLLRDQFFDHFVIAGMPTEAEMYAWTDIDDRGNYYFTPAAVALASDLMQEFGAVLCPAPDLQRLARLVGNTTDITGISA